MKYSLGLDIGISSVGWAVLENNEADEPFRIERMGVRIFDKAEQPKTGASLCEPRRNARNARRRLQRRKHRMERVRYFIQENGLMTLEDTQTLYEKPHFAESVYDLRVKALDILLNNEEWVRLLIHLCQHRGYQSNSKAEEAKEGKEIGRALTAISENEALMIEKGYRTIGEMLLKDEKFKYVNPDGSVLLKTRNSADDYSFTLNRKLVIEEIHYIFTQQRALGSNFATEDNEETYAEIFTSQRSFDEGPGGDSPFGGNLIEKRLGKCTFETEEPRAAKATFSFEYFRLLQSINNLRIWNVKEAPRPLTDEERKILVDFALSTETIHFGKIRIKLGLSDTETFTHLNYNQGKNEETEKVAKFKEMQSYHQIRKALNKVEKDAISSLNPETLNKIGTILTLYRNDKTRLGLLKEADVPEKYWDALLPLSFTKVGHLSLTALNKIIPNLEKGMTYDKACSEAYGDFRANFKGERKSKLSIDDIEYINNPVVRRGVSQTIKVVNAIVREYGSPQVVRVELAREMGKNFQERSKISKNQEENRSKNEAAAKQVEDFKGARATGEDILKFRLFQEQNGICLYSLENLDIAHLFDPGYVDIDHIIPYSLCFDDSFPNKVLVKAKENRQKGNRTPYQYFGKDEKRWSNFEAFVEGNVRDYKKRQKLLKIQLTDEDINGFKERNLNDTKYITRVVFNLFRQQLEFAPSNKYSKKPVYAVNGSITAKLRRQWGFPAKMRTDDLHHALDAAVVGTVGDAFIQRITRYTQNHEESFMDDGSVVDIKTGEIIPFEQWRDEDKFPTPWENFRKNVLDYIDLSRLDVDFDNRENLTPIFVSRMPNRKVTGSAHAETIRSGKLPGYSITKTPLSKLKLDGNNEIKGYYNPRDDKLLYEALRQRLIDFGGKGETAFNEPFFKPKSDGSQGPLVKKVKIAEKSTLSVPVHGGIADNGSMIRTDVFFVEGEGYYVVPIYVADTIKEELPNKAVVAAKPYEEWKEMKDKNFIFSLYSGDLIKAVHKNKMTLTKRDKTAKGEEKVSDKEFYLYYVGMNISTASLTVTSHDRGYLLPSLGVKRLKSLEKYEVDVLGNIHKVQLPQKRMFFKKKKK
ncbi:MAG: type II CRISPR RNA-guided endonuclease Cas9 [Clostridiales bacterium]